MSSLRFWRTGPRPSARRVSARSATPSPAYASASPPRPQQLAAPWTPPPPQDPCPMTTPSCEIAVHHTFLVLIVAFDLIVSAFFVSRRKAATASKFVVYLSDPVLALLKSYLVTCDLPLLVSLLNSHVDCRLRSGSKVLYPIHLPGYRLFEDSMLVLGGAGASAPTVMWGVPGGPAPPASIPDARSDRFLSEVVDKLVLPSALAAESRRRRREATTMMTMTMRAADSVGAGIETTTDENINPSVLFTTVANTYGSTICMDINEGASQVVCGFRDSVVRVFSTHSASLSGQQPGQGHDRAPLLPPRNATSPWPREVVPAPRASGSKRSKGVEAPQGIACLR